MINFSLQPQEATFIVQVLAQLPNSSNAFGLYQKCLEQFNGQNKVTSATTEGVNISDEVENS